MRLDVYLAQYWPEYSRSQWQKLCKDGFVEVGGEVVTDPSKKLGEDDEVRPNPPQKPTFESETLPVIYEDENVIVIDKPVGILTHAKGALNDEFSVAEFVKPMTTYKKDTNRPGIIHRLDRDTSGIIICAKNDQVASYLSRQFSDRKVKKEYLAVIESTPSQMEAEIDLPIARNPKKPSTFRVDPNGKPAQTMYKVLEHNDDHSLVLLSPHTGRTHQLRVHMSYIGNPMVGDRIYGKSADRLMLHAKQLEITLPGGKRKVFSAETPSDFFDYFPKHFSDKGKS